MRFKTPFQKQVVALSRRLPPITDNQLYAFVNNIQYPAFRDKKGYTCSSCGQTFTSETAYCPHCGRMLHYDDFYTNKRTIPNEYSYQGLVLHREGVTITRNFLFKATFYKKGGYTIRWSEVEQTFYKDGQFEVMAAKRDCLGRYIYESQWIFGSELTLKAHKYDEPYRYPLTCTTYHSKAKIPQLEYTPARAHYKSTTPNAVRACPQLETIYKQHPDLFRYFLADTHSLIQYWPTFKIAFRHHFEIGNIHDYLAHLFFLRRTKRDLRNPRYVAPDNFAEALQQSRAEYAAFLNRHYPRRERLVYQPHITDIEQEATDYETLYKTEHGEWLDLVIKAGKLTIRPLQSVKEFAEEGEAMQHCVYKCRYWKKPDTLILSARIGDDRIETVEVNTKTLDIIQSRGLRNQPTPYHNAILKAVQRHFAQVA